MTPQADLRQRKRPIEKLKRSPGPRIPASPPAVRLPIPRTPINGANRVSTNDRVCGSRSLACCSARYSRSASQRRDAARLCCSSSGDCVSYPLSDALPAMLCNLGSHCFYSESICIKSRESDFAVALPRPARCRVRPRRGSLRQCSHHESQEGGSAPHAESKELWLARRVSHSCRSSAPDDAPALSSAD